MNVKVCCNACKKPVKASQYAAHAGLEALPTLPLPSPFFYFIFNNFCWFRKLVLVSLRMLYNQPKHIREPTWNLRIEVVQKGKGLLGSNSYLLVIA